MSLHQPQQPVWKSYDPKWLVTLAHEQLANETWLPDALARCTRCFQKSNTYIYFVDPYQPNKPSAEWQFYQNLHLQHPTSGWLILYVLTENRIGGVEFVDQIRL